MAFISTKKTFFQAAVTGDIAELKYGLDANKYDINIKNADGNTVTHLAAINGQMEALKFLLARKPDLEVANNKSQTPLLSAAAEDKSKAAQALVAAGASVDTHNDSYAYPVHWAAHFGDLDLVKALADAGANLDVRTKDGEHTPTYYAIEKDRGAVLELLVSRGARTDIPATDNKTPYDIAREKYPRLQKIIDETPRAGATAAAAPAAPAASGPPANENKVEPARDGWVLMNDTTVAKTGNFPQLNRKLTEIFNFETRERLMISENLKTGAESMTAPESFSSLAKEQVESAAMELQRLGGRLPRTDAPGIAGSPIGRLKV